MNLSKIGKTLESFLNPICISLSFHSRKLTLFVIVFSEKWHLSLNVKTNRLGCRIWNLNLVCLSQVIMRLRRDCVDRTSFLCSQYIMQLLNISGLKSHTNFVYNSSPSKFCPIVIHFYKSSFGFDSPNSRQNYCFPHLLHWYLSTTILLCSLSLKFLFVVVFSRHCM